MYLVIKAGRALRVWP